MELLADAGQLLSLSLDYEATIHQVATMAVPELADWCAVYLLADGEREELEITSGHEDPELEALLRSVRRRRREIDGASESRRVAEALEPILAPDVRDVPPEPGQDAALTARLAAKSYMLVPLVARGRSVGSLTLLSTRDGRFYGNEDLRLAQALAARCALAIDNARLFEAAQRSLNVLDAVFASAPVGLAFVDRDLRFVRVNPTLAAFNSVPVEAHPGRTMSEVLGPDAAPIVDIYRQVIATGAAMHDLELSTAAGAAKRHWNVWCTPVKDADGEVAGASAVVVDVTESRRLLEAERDARKRADFLARAGELLDETLDYEQTLGAVAEVAVPEIADWCSVSVLDDRGALQQVVAAHVDAEQRRLGRELNRRFPPRPDGPSGTTRVARTGRTEFVREVTDEMLVAAIADEEQLRLVRQLDLRSVIIAPLRARSRVFGTLTLANTTGSRLFDAADVQLAEELARRAGAAIENARLYSERSHIARTLQARLLPARLPETAGARIAARYRAAGELNEVGGDFYDVFARPDGGWSIVVGDVTGKGPEAAAVTALIRYTLRARADDRDVTTALRRLNAAMRPPGEEAQFATAALAHVAPEPGGALHVRLALAGHPPPFVLRRDGTVEPAGTLGTMLALAPDPVFVPVELVLERGDLLLLYTDGVTEAGPRSRLLGEAGLGEVVRTLRGATPDQVVDAVLQVVDEVSVGEPRDDIALLAVAPAG